MKLFEIDEGIRACVDMENGEILDEDLLNSLLLEREKKLEGVALWIKELTYEAEALKAEKDKLEKRVKSTETKIRDLKKWLTFATGEERFKTTRANVYFTKTESVEVDDSTLIPKRYCNVSYTPSKAMIKYALKNGKRVKGCHLQINTNCVVK